MASPDSTEAGTSHGNQALQVTRWGTHQSKAFTGTAAAIDNAVATNCSLVRLIATENCYVAFGTAPTATTSSVYLAKDSAEYVIITPGHKVSAVRVSTSGTLHVTECI